MYLTLFPLKTSAESLRQQSTARFSWFVTKQEKRVVSRQVSEINKERTLNFSQSILISNHSVEFFSPPFGKIRGQFDKTSYPNQNHSNGSSVGSRSRRISYFNSSTFLKYRQKSRSLISPWKFSFLNTHEVFYSFFLHSGKTQPRTVSMRAYSLPHAGNESSLIWNETLAVGTHGGLPLVDPVAFKFLYDFVNQRLIINPFLKMKTEDIFRAYLAFLYEKDEVRELAPFYTISTEDFTVFYKEIRSKNTAEYPSFVIPRRRFAKLLEMTVKCRVELLVKKKKIAPTDVRLIRAQTMFLKGAGVLPTRPALSTLRPT